MIPGPFRIHARQYKLKAENRLGPITGDPIDKITVRADSSNPPTKCANLVHPKGLSDSDGDGLLENSNKARLMWLSEKGQNTGSLEFDFGKPQKVDQILVWNYNAKNQTFRGVKQADISVWTEQAGWKKLLDDFPFTEADASGDYDDPVQITLDGIEVQKVKFDDLVNFGDLNHVGLSKVMFYQPRGPKAVRPMPADGYVLNDISDLKLSWIPGLNAGAHRLYFGPEPNQMELLCETANTEHNDLPFIDRNSTYYWRVDEVLPDNSVAQGNLWRFGTGGLIGWWKLDEADGTQAADSGSFKLTGALYGNPQWQTDSGKVGGTLRFDGQGDYVQIKQNYRLNLYRQLTVACWIKVNAFDRQWQTIVCKGDTAWRIQRTDNGTGIHFACNGLTSQDGWDWGSLVDGDTPVNDGKWHHVAGVYDGRKMSLYIDGTLDASKKASGTIAGNKYHVRIGDNEEKPGRDWNGMIDDVRIYNCALTQPEIDALYAGTSPTEALKAAQAAAKAKRAAVAAKARDTGTDLTSESTETTTPTEESDTTADTETSGKKNTTWVLLIFALAAIVVFLVTRKQRTSTG